MSKNSHPYWNFHGRKINDALNKFQFFRYVNEHYYAFHVHATQFTNNILSTFSLKGCFEFELYTYIIYYYGCETTVFSIFTQINFIFCKKTNNNNNNMYAIIQQILNYVSFIVLQCSCRLKTLLPQRFSRPVLFRYIIYKLNRSKSNQTSKLCPK